MLVGGGNSAGQAAVYLSAHAAKVTMLVRGEGLAATMSRYLIDRITSAPNIELLAWKELTRLEGSAQAGLEFVTWRDRQTGIEERRASRNLFLFIGAEPETTFLSECEVELDKAGFIAPLWSVDDEDAGVVATELLERIGKRHEPIGAALREIRAAHGATSPTFYSYLYYGDVTARFAAR